MTLPFGEGEWTVFGYQTQQFDSNKGITADAQPLSRGTSLQPDTPIYRTNDEAEARELVRRGGFERDGIFYATTRIANIRDIEYVREQLTQKALKRDDPSFQ